MPLTITHLLPHTYQGFIIIIISSSSSRSKVGWFYNIYNI